MDIAGVSESQASIVCQGTEEIGREIESFLDDPKQTGWPRAAATTSPAAVALFETPPGACAMSMLLALLPQHQQRRRN